MDEVIQKYQIDLISWDETSLVFSFSVNSRISIKTILHFKKAQIIAFEFNSKFLPYDACERIKKVFEDTWTKLSPETKSVPEIVSRICKYLRMNLLIYFYDELRDIKHSLIHGRVTNISGNTFCVIFFDKLRVSVTIPFDYPRQNLLFEITSNIFPSYLLKQYQDMFIEKQQFSGECINILPTISHLSFRHDVQYLKHRKRLADDGNYNKKHRQKLKADAKKEWNRDSTPICTDAFNQDKKLDILPALLQIEKELSSFSCDICCERFIKEDYIRLHCCHWFHLHCLESKIMFPPFLKDCWTCSAPIVQFDLNAVDHETKYYNRLQSLQQEHDIQEFLS